jgi:signal transduction histidine kinase
MNSIFKKGLLLIAAPLVFQAVFLSFLLWNGRENVAAERWALHTRLVIGQAEAALRALTQESNRVRGLVITGNPVFAAGPQRKVVERADELRRLVADNPLQERRIEEFRATAVALEGWVAELEGLVRAGKAGAAADLVRGLRGERLLRDAGAELETFLAEEQRLDRERVDELDRNRRYQRRLLLSAAAVAAATALLLAWAFARSVSSRLEVVALNARRLAESSPLAPPVGGRDEIAQLDATVRQTAERLAAAAAAERRHTAELTRANEDLQAKTREIETFVYSVSHDLRSPLVNLQGFSRELEQSCGDLRRALGKAELPPDVRTRLDAVDHDMVESLRFIQTAVSRSGNIIEALLRLSRAGRVEYQWQQVDVGAVVRRVADAIRATAGQKGARITAAGLPPAWADPTAVEQIFGNLLSNALNYLDPGRPGVIEIGGEIGEAGATAATYWVKDNGLGIPASYLPKLFVAFQRLHGSIAPGEGMGLALVRRVVERHGGKIWAESREGEGTTFFFTLPTGGEDREVEWPHSQGQAEAVPREETR